MRIIFAVGAYWPSVGGVQKVTGCLAEEMVKAGHDVIVVTKNPGDSLEEEMHNGVKIVRFKERDILKFHYGEKKEYQEYLLKNAINSDVLVVVCANNFVAQWIYPIIHKIRCRKVMFQHGMYDGKLYLKRINTFHRLIKQVLLTIWWEIYHKYYWEKIKMFDSCIHLFQNDSSYNYFEKRGYRNNYVLLNSCEDVFFDENVNERVTDKYNIKKPYFIYVANYCTGKNQLLAVEQYINSKCKNIQLVFVGSIDNDYCKKVRRKAKGIEDIYVISGAPRDDVIQLIKNAYAIVLTSENEYLPVTILEGMAASKPFISTDVGVAGQLPGGNICNSKELLSYWLKYYEMNPEYVEKMGKIASDYARKNLMLGDKVKQFEEILLQSGQE